MTEKRIVDSTEVWGAKTLLSEEHTVVWMFHDFMSLPHRRGQKVECPPLNCHGHSWSLELYPRTSNLTDGNYVTVKLRLNFAEDGPGDVKINFTIRCGGKTRSSDYTFTKLSACHGWDRFVDRESVRSNLSDGAAIVEVDLVEYLDKPKPWFPKQNINDDMLKILESGKWADVTFVVGCTKFRAHRGILAVRAPMLAELAEDAPLGTEIEIQNVNESTFLAILRFAYANEDPFVAESSTDACKLLEAADRFGCTELKFLSEYHLVKSGMDVGNAAELLMLADAHSCALLKEAMTNFIIAHPVAVMASPGWAEVEKSASLMVDITKTALIKKAQVKDSDDDLDLMDVAALRQKLSAAGLCVDGTREMLVKRLSSQNSSE